MVIPVASRITQYCTLPWPVLSDDTMNLGIKCCQSYGFKHFQQEVNSKYGVIRNVFFLVNTLSKGQGAGKHLSNCGEEGVMAEDDCVRSVFVHVVSN